MSSSTFAPAIDGAVTSSGLSSDIPVVAGAAIGLGVLMYGFRRAWSFFKSLAK